MRNTVDRWLQDHNIELLHPDVWPGTGINCGVSEVAITSIALGLAEYKPVAIYGIAGFVLLKAAEIIKLYQPKHSVLILNAGANGCYPKDIGTGHQIDYDAELCNILGITLDDPYPGKESYEDMVHAVDTTLSDLVKQPGWHLVRMGWDWN